MKKYSKFQQGGNNELMQLFEQFANSVEDDDFKSGKDVYAEFVKLNPQEQEQFLSTIKEQNNAQLNESEQNPVDNSQDMQDTALMQTGGINDEYTEDLLHDLGHRLTEDRKKKILKETHNPFIETKGISSVMFKKANKKQLYNIDVLSDSPKISGMPKDNIISRSHYNNQDNEMFLDNKDYLAEVSHAYQNVYNNRNTHIKKNNYFGKPKDDIIYINDSKGRSEYDKIEYSRPGSTENQAHGIIEPYFNEMVYGDNEKSNKKYNNLLNFKDTKQDMLNKFIRNKKVVPSTLEERREAENLYFNQKLSEDTTLNANEKARIQKYRNFREHPERTSLELGWEDNPKIKKYIDNNLIAFPNHPDLNSLYDQKENELKNKSNWNNIRESKKSLNYQTGGATNAVRKYQQMLNDKYGANLKVDGIWGKHTQSVYENSGLNKMDSKLINIESKEFNPQITYNPFAKENRNKDTPELLKPKTFDSNRPQDLTGYSNSTDWSNHFDKQTNSMDNYFNNVKPIKRYETKAKERRALMSPQEESDWINNGGVGIRGSAMENRTRTPQNEADFRANKTNRSGERLTPEQIQQSFDDAGVGVTEDTMDYILKERAKERKSTDIPGYWDDKNHDEYIRQKFGKSVQKPKQDVYRIDDNSVNRNKDQVEFKSTNNGKAWTPEEYSKYIDEQRAKTANYNNRKSHDKKRQTGGIPTNKNGYYELNPNENPIARIPSGRITMKGINYPIQAIGGTTGKDYGMMQPDEEYNFPYEKSMYEIPKAQTGNKLLNEVVVKGKKNRKSSKFFRPDYTEEELDQQKREKSNYETPELITNSKTFKQIPVNNVQLPLVKPLDLKFRHTSSTSEPNNGISLDYNNESEARAIAFKHLKNNSTLAPFRKTVNLENPELIQESIDPYLNNMKEQRNAMLQQVNPNTTAGQALLSQMHSQNLSQENDVIGQVSGRNRQLQNQYNNQAIETRNKNKLLNLTNDSNYYDDIAQLQSQKDDNDIGYMNEIANYKAKGLSAKNKFLNLAIESGLPKEVLNVGDNNVEFDISKKPYEVFNPMGKNKNNNNIVTIDGKQMIVQYDKDGKMTLVPISNKSQTGRKWKVNY